MTYHDVEFKFLYVVVDGKKKNPGHIYDEKTRTTLCGHPFGIMIGAKIYATRDETMGLCEKCSAEYKVREGTKWSEWTKAAKKHKSTIPKENKNA